MKPAHIHIKKDDGYAKLWLSPVELAKATNFAAHELNEIIKITMEYSDYFREKWNEYFSNKI